MGYRSVIAGVFTVDDYFHASTDDNGDEIPFDEVALKQKFKEMVGFIKLSPFYEEMETEYKNDGDHLGWCDGKFLFYACDWKWYDSYSIVKAWDKLWNDMQSIEGVSGYFVRVGENRADIEEMEFGDAPHYEAFRAYTTLDLEEDYILKNRKTDEEEQTTKGDANTQPDSASVSS
jgi:hypothetical protein